MSTTTTSARITVDEFEISDLYDDNRVELIDGEVNRKDEMKPAHVLAVEFGEAQRWTHAAGPPIHPTGRSCPNSEFQ